MKMLEGFIWLKVSLLKRCRSSGEKAVVTSTKSSHKQQPILQTNTTISVYTNLYLRWLNWWIRGLGDVFDGEKKPQIKISWQCPFKGIPSVKKFVWRVWPYQRFGGGQLRRGMRLRPPLTHCAGFVRCRQTGPRQMASACQGGIISNEFFTRWT